MSGFTRYAPESLVGYAKATASAFSLTYAQIKQGSISKGDVLLNTRNDKKIKIPRLVRTNAEDMEDLKRAGAGEICALFGVDCASGDTFTNATQASKLAMESLHVPEPVISLAVKPVKSDSGSFSKAIGRFTREDPTFRFEVDQDTGDRVMSGMGELHLEIYVERMKREYDCPVETGKPRVNYKENILRKARFEHLLKKQTGGSGQYAGVMGFIEPVGDGSRENIFDNRCTGTNIPSQFYSAIEKGFQEGLKEGPLAGCAIEGVRFVLLDGKAHLVDSSELAFKAATKHAFKEAFLKAAPSLLEPIMNLQVQIPGEFQGQVIGALSKRRGVVMNSTSIDENIVMDMEVPLGDMFGFSTELRSLTQGKGEFAMEYLEHRGAPRNTVARVAEEHQQRKEELKKN
uniref:Tr-type G domain-containing protein n=1 Tax=Rhodosorus marinus TaxID=101924 RepID=A0A7S2ZJ55_9RHOD|mmetsp:Transcript_21282/g.87014  ORF Transcript_21282/g.87014 Transcript_21282/m.87014 type:complete len:402 (+) Transcript_21282:218-1423(+)